MAVHETEALTLRNYGLADADKIVVFLTRGFGVIKCVAKGAKKLNSRYGSTLEPFTKVDLTFFLKDNRDLASIREIELRHSLFETSTTPEVLKTLYYFSRLLVEFVPPNEQSEKMYRMVSVCAEAISEKPEKLDQITLYFETWLLRLAGFMPDWSKCAVCEKRFGENDAAVLDAAFHLSHLSCQPYRKEPRVSAEQRLVMARIQTLPPRDFLTAIENIYKGDIPGLSIHLQGLISHVLGKDIENTKYVLPEELIREAANTR